MSYVTSITLKRESLTALLNAQSNWEAHAVVRYALECDTISTNALAIRGLRVPLAPGLRDRIKAKMAIEGTPAKIRIRIYRDMRRYRRTRYCVDFR
jgi:hypothetical protein